MVAVIHQASSLRRVLNYNENKVKEGVALCFDAPYYLKDPGQLSFDQKLFRLSNLASLNPETKVNTVHISLNFDPSEDPSLEMLRSISADYMNKIGFAEQPYLLYRHFDAAHPHVHILTTNIKPDGSRISLHNLGKIKSEQARKELEIQYGLVKAQDKPKRALYELKGASHQAVYGKSHTKRTITTIVSSVLKDYQFTSLSELNAVLKLYNVCAETGSEDSRTYKTGGLVYRILQADGTPIGTPIKASLIYDKPTLKKLESLYPGKELARQQHKGRLKSAIDFALLNNANIGLTGLVKELERQGIDTVLRYTKQGKVFGLTYIDHRNSCVFNGSSLGKDYSAAAIGRRCGEPALLVPGKKTVELKPLPVGPGAPGYTPAPLNPHLPGTPESILHILLHPEQDSSYLPYELSGKKKPKKKSKAQRI